MSSDENGDIIKPKLTVTITTTTSCNFFYCDVIVVLIGVLEKRAAAVSKTG